MPPRVPIKTVTTRNENLEDVPFHVFTHRGQWSDFRRSLTSCGLVWGLPDWSTTILHGGAQWELLAKAGKKLNEIFPPPKATVGDEKAVDVAGLSHDLLVALGMATKGAEPLPSKKSANLSTLKYEDDNKLAARQKMWTWLVMSLQGTGTTPGPFYYLTKQVEIFDIAGLYGKLSAIMEVVTICTLEDEVNAVSNMEFDPTKQDIFSYVQDLKRAMEVLEETNKKLQEGDRVIFSDMYVRTRIIRAARRVPVF
jgi:hypothetical protein